MSQRPLLPVAILALIVLGARVAVAVEASSEAERIEFFEKVVRPVLAERCWGCHGGPAKVPAIDRAGAGAVGKKRVVVKGGLNLTNRASLLAGGDSGPAAMPGNTEESLIVRAIRYHDEPRMPPEKRLSEVEIQNLTRWVEIGLPWPSSNVDTSGQSAASLPSRSSAKHFPGKDRGHWSFRPVVDPPVPVVRDHAWPLSPIDRFLLARLEAEGLKPAPPADRMTLIRRASFDLIGLPPTAEQVQAFAADLAPDAFARMVERLLASPHYGERWGRHWLDLARYADTAGETADFPVPEAYRYRDYVIDAFNRDLPYDRFVAEQVAGDLTARGSAPGSLQPIVATGFLAVARRFGFDPQNYHHLTIEDTIDTLGKAFLGLTIACARCHDHKFDPIASEDYYALYGIFASSRYPFPGSEETKRPRDFVPLGTDPAMASVVAKVSLPGRAPVALAYAMAESEHPANARLQRRGDPKNLGSEVPRRFLTVLERQGDPRIESGSGRRELAAWLTDRRNPLTARVLVNRVWQHHFGRGIVATPSDFGSRGAAPSHPELLDWLATRFVEDGWSIKALHRRIMLSQAYQMASDDPSAPVNARVHGRDPENAWLSHANRRRLDAESLRDAILQLGGDLEIGPGGPHPFPPVESWKFTQHAPFQAVYETRRRSVYLMTQRIRRHPFLALFDGPDTNTSTPGRNNTTVPTQALFFLNNPLVHRESDGFASRLRDARSLDADRVDLAYLMALARPASDQERDQSIRYIEDCRREFALDRLSGEDLVRQSWASFARTLLASNEFLYLN